MGRFLGNMCVCVGVLIVILILLALDFAMCAGIAWLILWCFGIDFSVKIAFGIWLITLLLHLIFKKK